MNWLRRGRHLAIGGKKGLHRKNKKNVDGLQWEEKEADGEEEDSLMVKGLSRRVIVVKAPDERVFEQAIFIIREDFAASGISEKELLRQARRAANEYLNGSGCRGGKRLFRILRPPLYAAAGAAATVAAWFALHLTKI